MAETEGHPNQRNRHGWRLLGAFWLTTLSLMTVSAGVLELLGPPGERPTAPPRREAVRPATADERKVTVSVWPKPVAAVVAGRDTPGPVADPDPSLLEPRAAGSKDN